MPTAMLFYIGEEDGKLNKAPGIAQLGAETSNRLYVRDRATNTRYLIDSGANVSVVPVRWKNTKQSNDLVLYAANGTTIKTYGKITLTLDLGLLRPLRATFIEADVKQHIIGADFLQHHQLLIDIHGKKIIEKKSNRTATATSAWTAIPTVRAVEEAPFDRIFDEFPSLSSAQTMARQPKHTVEHHIETTGPPVFARPRPLNPEKYIAAKKLFDEMIEAGTCQPSKSQWASPLHLVTKSNGELRACGDYRRLNSCTIPDRYTIPRLQDFTHGLQGMTIFSTLDLAKAYYQIPVRKEDVEKTAITTPFGLFEMKKMSFGLRNGAQSMQRFMNEMLRGCNYTFAYIDDVLIASKDKKQHEIHLREILTRFDAHGIVINRNKCQIGKEEVDFLGYTVGAEGIRPKEEKIAAIKEFPRPKDVQELRRFLGMINFYRQSIPGAAKYQAQLNQYLQGTKRKDQTPIKWTPETIEAFEKSRDSIGQAVMLAHPATGVPLVLMTDASATHAGASLQQRINDKWTPLGFFSKALTTAQRMYAAYDRELLAMYLSVRYFRKTVEGRELTIYTDHKPLIHALKKLNDTPTETPMRIRHTAYIAQFASTIEYVPGKDNIVADALSRVEEIYGPTKIPYDEIAKQQQQSRELEELRKKAHLAFELVAEQGGGTQIWCETSTGRPRPFITPEFRQAAIELVHSLSHPGVRTTRKMVAERFFWPAINTDSARYAKNCISCQRAKTHIHTRTPLGTFMEAERFEHVHIDIVGPIGISNGQRYLLTMIDRATKWPECFPMQDMTAENVARIFYDGWIARFGCPKRITTDQGRQFEAGLFKELTQLVGAQKIHTTAFHPQANGMIERWHRSLKAALMARLNTENWTNELTTVLLGLRAALKEDIGMSSAEMVYGRNIKLPGEFFEARTTTSPQEFVERIRHSIARHKPTPKRNSVIKTFVHPDLSKVTHVFLRDDTVRKPLSPPYAGPYRVISRREKTLEIQMERRIVTVSMDRVKPAYILAQETATPEEEPSRETPTAPRRGRTRPSEAGYTTRSGRISKPPDRWLQAPTGDSKGDGDVANIQRP